MLSVRTIRNKPDSIGFSMRKKLKSLRFQALPDRSGMYTIETMQGVCRRCGGPVKQAPGARIETEEGGAV